MFTKIGRTFTLQKQDHTNLLEAWPLSGRPRVVKLQLDVVQRTRYANRSLPNMQPYSGTSFRISLGLMQISYCKFQLIQGGSCLNDIRLRGLLLL